MEIVHAHVGGACEACRFDGFGKGLWVGLILGAFVMTAFAIIAWKVAERLAA